MKRIVRIIVLLLAPLALNAQQIGMYSHYFYKPMVYNPAFTGHGDISNVMVISRAQWSDFQGSPQLNIATMDGSIMDKKAGLGIMLISDRKGITSRTGGDLSYSYRLKLNEDARLMFGVGLGIVDQVIDYSKAMVETYSDPTMFSDSQRKTVFNANAGLGLTWKGLEFGFAVPQLLGNKIKYVDTSNVRAYYTQERHYMGSLKYSFFLSQEKGISLAPQVLVRFLPNAPLQYDGNLNLEWRDKFWIGATYKSGYAVGANAGFCIHKQLYVGYSYDFITGNIGKYAGTSHELMLNFKFGRNKKEAVAEPVAEENKTLENSAYEQRMDSLEMELQQSQDQLKRLSDKLDQQEKLQQQLQRSQQNQNQQNPQSNQNPPVRQDQAQQNNQQQSVPSSGEGQGDKGNQNTTVSESSPNKKYEQGALIVSSPASGFKDLNSKTPPKGFFVVIGTYFYQDLAMAEAQRFVAKGYKTTDWVYSGPKNYNYIFMFKCKTKEEAMEKLKVAREAGVKDAWIQELTD